MWNKLSIIPPQPRHLFHLERYMTVRQGMKRDLQYEMEKGNDCASIPLSLAVRLALRRICRNPILQL